MGVRVRQDSTTKIYREGKWPVLRGTFWKLDDRSGCPWASGFKASVLSYDRWEMPMPLRIDIEHGEATVELVAVTSLDSRNSTTTPARSAMRRQSRSTCRTQSARFSSRIRPSTIRVQNFKFYI